MKKGLILALMVGLGIMAGPVMAEAPVFPELPKIIIGNTEDVSATSQTVWRYVNALNLLDTVDWKNPTFTSGTYNAYWSGANDQSGIDVRVSGSSSWVDELTAAELVNLTDDTGTSFGMAPPAGSEITGAADFWLSLMNLTATTTNTGTSERYPGNAYLASALITEWGITDVAASVAGTVNDLGSTPTVLTLIAAVTSGTGGQVLPSEPAFLEVHNVWGGQDGTTSTLAYHEYPVEAVDGVSGWFWKPVVADGTWIVPATKAAEPTVGFSVAASDTPTPTGTFFGEWQMADGGTQDSVIYTADAPSMGGKLFNARLRLSNPTAPTASLCPSYRILYANIAFTHIGGMKVVTAEDLGAPSSGGKDFVAQLFWEVPAGLTESADGGNLSTWPFPSGSISEHPDRTATSNEWRDYTLLFNLMHQLGQDGDFGTLAIEEVAIEVIDAPTVPVATPVSYNTTNWLGFGLNGAFPTIFSVGSATICASVTITARSDSSLGFRFWQVNPPAAAAIGGNLADHLGLVDNQLVRFSMSAQSVSVATTPIFRVFLHANSSDPADIAAPALNYDWEDEYGAAETFVKPDAWDVTTVVTGFTNPGVPPATAATLSTWIYTHTGWVTGNYILPDVSIFSKNKYATGTSVHGWEDDGGGVTFDTVAIEAYDSW